MNASSYLIRIIDDDPTVYESLRFILEVAGWRTCWYERATDFLAKDNFEEPGALLLDVRMPAMSGIELQHEMQRRGIDLPIVFLSAHADVEMAVEAVKDGADDFLIKPPHAEKLLEALTRACKRFTQLRNLQREEQELENDWKKLTAAEQETAQLIAKDFGNKEIASLLNLKDDSVRSRRASVFAKLGVSSAVELTDFLHHKAELSTQIRALQKRPDHHAD